MGGDCGYGPSVWMRRAGMGMWSRAGRIGECLIVLGVE